HTSSLRECSRCGRILQSFIMVYCDSMKATTIKLDGPILRELKEMQRPGENLTSHVRDLLKAQIRKRKMAQAAEEYAAFLSQNSEEFAEVEAWASAPLDRERTVRPKKKA